MNETQFFNIDMGGADSYTTFNYVGDTLDEPEPLIDPSASTVLDPETQLGLAGENVYPSVGLFPNDILEPITEPHQFSPTGDIVTDIIIQEAQAEIQAVNDFILPDEMVLTAVKEACDFFHIEEVPVINADQTCVWNQDGATAEDDVLGFNRAQLMEIGVSGQDSLTLIYTHECAHRALQGIPNLDNWEHELACDYFAGIHAGIDGIDTGNFKDSLASSGGSHSHPSGVLRASVIDHGVAMVQQMQAEGTDITFENCLDKFNEFLSEQASVISEQKTLYDV